MSDAKSELYEMFSSYTGKEMKDIKAFVEALQASPGVANIHPPVPPAAARTAEANFWQPQRGNAQTAI